jgi:hypothetical protein
MASSKKVGCAGLELHTGFGLLTDAGTQTKTDAVIALAHSLRAKGGFPYASAKLEMDVDSVRVEFFRGKDAARHLRAHPELFTGIVAPTKPGCPPSTAQTCSIASLANPSYSWQGGTSRIRWWT